MLRLSVAPNVLALALVVAGLPSIVHAQAVPRTLTGVVSDTLGRPLEDAVIVLNPMGGVIKINKLSIHAAFEAFLCHLPFEIGVLFTPQNKRRHFDKRVG